MRTKKISSVLAILVGIAMIFFSLYIMGEVAQGRDRLSKAQGSLNKSQGLFGLTPVTEEVGHGVTRGTQKKLDAYGAEADEYARLAIWLRVGGIILIAVGAGSLFMLKRRKQP